jgi:signal transduction histidine kinase
MSSGTCEQTSDANERTDLAGRLRAVVPTVIPSIIPNLKEVSEAFRRPPPEVIVGIVEDYISSLANSISCDSLEPMEAFLDRVEPHWAPSGLGVSHVMHGLFVINDACWDQMRQPGDDPQLFQWWGREAMRMVPEGSVAAINRKLAGELERHRVIEERLVSLQRVSATVLSEVDLESMLQTIVDEAMKLIGASAAVIRLVDRESTNLRIIALAGERDSLLSRDAMPVHGSLAGYSFRSGEPVISNNIAQDTRISSDLRQSSKLRSLLIVPLIVREAAIGALLVSDRLRGPFTHEDQRLLSLFADQAATAIEHAQLYRQAQHQIAELAALHRISNVISSSLEIEDVFMAIYHEIRQVMTTDAFLIGLARPDGLFDIDFIIDGGQRFAPRHAFDLSSPMARARHERRAVIISDIHAEGVPPVHTVGHPQTRVRSIVTAPLLKGNEVVGLLSAQSYKPDTYQEGDAQLLMTIANHAVVAVEHARLFRQAQSLAVAEERNRLAREIHDTLAQGLIATILYLERLDLKVADADESTRQLVDRALMLTRDNLEEARRSVHDLRAAPLDGRTLLEALHNLVDDLREEGLFNVDLRAPLSLPLFAALVETALFRIVQEAISNCRKHADCSAIVLDVALDDNTLSLCVTDNGCGFDVAEARERPERFGLSSMFERVTQIGGTLDIQSKPGDGTTVSVRIPLERATHTDLACCNFSPLSNTVQVHGLRSASVEW